VLLKSKAAAAAVDRSSKLPPLISSTPWREPSSIAASLAPHRARRRVNSFALSSLENSARRAGSNSRLRSCRQLMRPRVHAPNTAHSSWRHSRTIHSGAAASPCSRRQAPVFAAALDMCFEFHSCTRSPVVGTRQSPRMRQKPQLCRFEMGWVGANSFGERGQRPRMTHTDYLGIRIGFARDTTA